MEGFNRRSGGFGGSRGFGGNRGGGSRRGFNDGPREMHKAVCADCKKECEVPFKPSQDRPVYCKECYFKRKDSGSVGAPSAPMVEEKPTETEEVSEEEQMDEAA